MARQVANKAPEAYRISASRVTQYPSAQILAAGVLWVGRVGRDADTRDALLTGRRPLFCSADVGGAGRPPLIHRFGFNTSETPHLGAEFAARSAFLGLAADASVLVAHRRRPEPRAVSTGAPSSQTLLFLSPIAAGLNLVPSLRARPRRRRFCSLSPIAAGLNLVPSLRARLRRRRFCSCRPSPPA
ncbi:hypothetical protein EVAR_52641_1 [Eumeta japonica]|uniref:Uncharacterized protein n=1 Tax=Eumeta variegata TaxID=151549 RepID=A0A4C1XZ27_EUMVA|nr:hypothetical protein EVAR_52641_1 [Eumeta japonica]